MRILLFEPKYVGHFLGFAAVTAKAFADVGCDVVMALPQKAKDSPAASVKLRELPPSVAIRYAYDVPKKYDKWENGVFETAALSELLSDEDWDHLVVPSADFVLFGLIRNRALRRQLRSLSSADFILHNCIQVYPGLGRKSRIVSVLDRLAVSLARGVRLHTVDPFATSPASIARQSLFGNPVRPLPHFVEVPGQIPTQSEARSALDLPPDGKMLGSIGDLGRRKGTELLIESFLNCELSASTRLVLFGTLCGAAKEILRANQKAVDEARIIVRDRFVSDKEFQFFFPAMDAIWAGYPHQVGISSTLLIAAMANRPVIASDFGAVGWMTSEYGLGRVDPANMESMSDAIAWFETTDQWRPNADGAKSLLEYHTTANFADCITRGLRDRLDREESLFRHGNQKGAPQ